MDTVSSARRLLVLLPQLPHDPASGAARTAATVGELLADAGFSVQTIGTTATEGHGTLELAGWSAGDAATAVSDRVMGATVLRFERRRVSYALVDTGAAPVGDWATSSAGLYDQLIDHALETFRPEIVLTYGGSRLEVARHRRLQRMGVRVVFALYNARYLEHRFFDRYDGVITPSEFLATRYRQAIGARTTVLPTALWPDDVLASRHDPIYLTMVNPSLDKGLVPFAGIAAALAVQHPEIPIQVYASRVSPSFLMQAALASGIDLSQHPRLVIHSGTTLPRTIYRDARVVVVPSLVEDAAPRVVAEALVNGVPPVGSDRGGIPEMCADAGFVVPLPRDLDAGSLRRWPVESLRPWVERIATLFDAGGVWEQASAQALRSGARYLPPAVTPAYVEYFERLLRARSGRLSDLPV